MATAAIPESDHDALCEVINGEHVEKKVGWHESFLAMQLLKLLHHFLWDHPMGIAGMEFLCRLRDNPALERRPDLAFISRERLPARFLPNASACPVVPDLVAEIVSPSNTADEVNAKIHEYLQHGVRVVWVIYPRQCNMYVHERGSAQIRQLTQNDTLDGGTVLPGFQIPVARIFESVHLQP